MGGGGCLGHGGTARASGTFSPSGIVSGIPPPLNTLFARHRDAESRGISPSTMNELPEKYRNILQLGDAEDPPGLSGPRKHGAQARQAAHRRPHMAGRAPLPLAARFLLAARPLAARPLAATASDGHFTRDQLRRCESTHRPFDAEGPFCARSKLTEPAKTPANPPICSTYAGLFQAGETEKPLLERNKWWSRAGFDAGESPDLQHLRGAVSGRGKEEATT